MTDQVMGFQRFSVYGSEYLGDEPMESAAEHPDDRGYMVYL